MNRHDVEIVLEQIPIDFGGGCSVSKAWLMAWLIQRFSLRTTLDIGVYKGRSLFPQALAHKECSKSLVYGVDPWGKEYAREQDNPELPDRPKLTAEISDWVEKTDFQLIYDEVISLKTRLHLDAQCRLIRQSSEEAISYFQNKNIHFNMIHIDGNHDSVAVMKDIQLYTPRLRWNGFLVLDDVSWLSVRPAYDWLSENMRRVFERVGDGDDYAIFWKGRSRPREFVIRHMIKRISSR